MADFPWFVIRSKINVMERLSFNRRTWTSSMNNSYNFSDIDPLHVSWWKWSFASKWRYLDVSWTKPFVDYSFKLSSIGFSLYFSDSSYLIQWRQRRYLWKQLSFFRTLFPFITQTAWQIYSIVSGSFCQNQDDKEESIQETWGILE